MKLSAHISVLVAVFLSTFVWVSNSVALQPCLATCASQYPLSTNSTSSCDAVGDNLSEFLFCRHTNCEYSPMESSSDCLSLFALGFPPYLLPPICPNATAFCTNNVTEFPVSDFLPNTHSCVLNCELTYGKILTGVTQSCSSVISNVESFSNCINSCNPSTGSLFTTLSECEAFVNTYSLNLTEICNVCEEVLKKDDNKPKNDTNAGRVFLLAILILVIGLCLTASAFAVLKVIKEKSESGESFVGAVSVKAKSLIGG